MSSDDIDATLERVPDYDELLSAAHDLDAAEELTLLHQQYSSIDERNFFYNNKAAALQAVKDACTAGKAVEAGKTEAERDDPHDPAYAYKTVRCFMRYALMGIKNSQLRAEYINNVKKGVADFATSAIARAGPGGPSAATVELLIETRSMIRQAHLARSTKTSFGFAEYLRNGQTDFGTLFTSARAKRFPAVPVGPLAEAQQAEVLCDIIQSSGRTSIKHDRLYKAQGILGWSVVLVTLGLAVYDIVQSEVDVVTKVEKILVDGASFAAGWAGSAIAEAAAIKVFGDTAVLSVVFFGIIGGVIAGLGTAILLGTFVNIFRDASTNQVLWESYLQEPLVYKVKLPLVHLKL